MSPLIRALDQVLTQGETLLFCLNDELYKTQSKDNGGSIGAHYRHCLDHFERLFDGVQSGLIDYDARKRDQSLELIRDAALARTREFRNSAHAIEIQNLPPTIRIRCAVSSDEGESPDITSTIEREIMFCLSHAIHHYAIIGMICRAREIRLPENFGVAPSTLNYRRATAKVAA